MKMLFSTEECDVCGVLLVMTMSPIKTERLPHSEKTSAKSSAAAGSHGFLPVLPDRPLFGTDGIRGQVGHLLNAPLALQIGFCVGQVLQAETASSGLMVLGQDSRNSSDMLAMALSAGLNAAGVEVWNLGLCPTPCVSYLTSISEAMGGVMISASHNPPADNGIKFFGADGAKLPLDLQARIEVALRGQGQPGMPVNGGAANTWGKSHHRPDLLAQYVDSLKQSILSEFEKSSLPEPVSEKPLAGMRLVLDLAWGAATQLAPATFKAMGAEVICLHDRPDGDRINVQCGSTNLGPLKRAVEQHQADLGFAFDGDADRVLAVDGQGRFVDGDYLLYFWGQRLQAAGKLPGNTIVSTVMSNLGFERAWEQLGGTLIRTAVGDQHVHAEMLQRGAMLGGEQSGHILCRHYGVSGDGLMTALHFAMLVQQSEGSLAELVNQSFQPYPQLLRNVRVEDCDRRLNWKNCEVLQNAIAQAEAAMEDQGRVLVRASGTEPVIRVMVEAASEDLTQYWTENLVLAVQKYRSS